MEIRVRRSTLYLDEKPADRDITIERDLWLIATSRYNDDIDMFQKIPLLFNAKSSKIGDEDIKEFLDNYIQYWKACCTVFNYLESPDILKQAWTIRQQFVMSFTKFDESGIAKRMKRNVLIKN